MSWICPKCETENHVQCEVCNEPIFNARKENDSGQTFEDVQSHLPYKFREKVVQYLNNTLGDKIHEETIRRLCENATHKDVPWEEGTHIPYQYASTVIGGYQDILDKIINEFCNNPPMKDESRIVISLLYGMLADMHSKILGIEQLIEGGESDLNDIFQNSLNILSVKLLKGEKEKIEKDAHLMAQDLEVLEKAARIIQKYLPLKE